MYSMNKENIGNELSYNREAPQIIRSSKKKSPIKKILTISLLFLLLCGGLWFSFQKSESLRTIFSINPKTEQEAMSRYLSQIGHLMLIPKDDTPVLATVEDPDLLIKQQAFFQGSQKGDVVIIFPKNRRAVLYSPKRNIIVNAGPVLNNQQQSTTTVY